MLLEDGLLLVVGLGRGQGQLLAVLVVVVGHVLGAVLHRVENNVHAPRGEHHGDDEEGEAGLEQRRGEIGSGLDDGADGALEGLLPGEAHEDAEGAHDGVDGLVRLGAGGLEGCQLLKHEDEREGVDGEEAREDDLEQGAVLVYADELGEVGGGHHPDPGEVEAPAVDHGAGHREHAHRLLHLDAREEGREGRGHGVDEDDDAAEEGREVAEAHEPQDLGPVVVLDVLRGLAAVAVGQNAAEGVAEDLHEEEGREQSHDVLATLLRLLVQKVLIRSRASRGELMAQGAVGSHHEDNDDTGDDH
mmetsp:Transcript_44323/g.106499  ORF Transcript_44323/g.106499 Transcript_44323/m.106499 type:complete len:303 (-) Transcript_44323:810-1718(-)